MLHRGIRSACACLSGWKLRNRAAYRNARPKRTSAGYGDVAPRAADRVQPAHQQSDSAANKHADCVKCPVCDGHTHPVAHRRPDCHPERDGVSNSYSDCRGDAICDPPHDPNRAANRHADTHAAAYGHPGPNRDAHPGHVDASTRDFDVAPSVPHPAPADQSSASSGVDLRL